LHISSLYANAPKATFWALLYILATPGLAKKIRQETSKAFPATGRRIPNLDYLVSSCPYLIASISETLRLASHSNSTRLVDEDTVINGYLLRKGAVIMSPSSHLHVDPSWGPDTLSFNPERFISDQSLDKANNQNYRPFGGGRTYCPGRFLAKQEISGFIAIMLDRYDMELISEVPAMNRTKFSLGTLEPVDPRQVIVRVRGLVKD
jgi:cytochrome P450